jgi:hypothetical protein
VREDDTVARRKARPVKHAAHGALDVTLLERLEVGHEPGA